MNLKMVAGLRSGDRGAFTVREYKAYKGRNPENLENI